MFELLKNTAFSLSKLEKRRITAELRNMDLFEGAEIKRYILELVEVYLNFAQGKLGKPDAMKLVGMIENKFNSSVKTRSADAKAQIDLIEVSGI